MAKHNHIIDTIDECITAGVKNKILHLSADDGFADGKTISVSSKTLINFASYSYLGLEVHPKLKDGGIKAIQKYGSQFGASRAYVSIHLYEELEKLFGEIFGAPTLVAPSTTLAHQAAIPVLVRDEDVVILDQYVHSSVQATVKMLQARKIPVELLRHNHVEKLEERIKELKNKFRKIWYMLDGVYSMYGDYAPLKRLYEMVEQHEQLQLYVDDAHGMSWAGENGAGYALSQINLHPQIILITSLNKAFAGAGGAMVFPNREDYRKVRNCGGTLIFSTPIQPPMLGVNVASAGIHLSNEIKILQLNLQKRIEYFYLLVKQAGLPLISKDRSPIAYIGLGKPRVGYNMVKRMMNEGFYISIGLFPAVSMKCSGLRCCINVHQTLKDITELVKAIEYHLPLAIAEEGVIRSEIYKAFNMPAPEAEPLTGQGAVQKQTPLKLEYFTTIHSINKREWNELLGANGSFDWDGLAFIEDVFCNNPKPEHNWTLHYFIIRTTENKPVLATFFTVALCKDDIFAPAAVSESIEQERKINPYYLCSKVLMMGSLLTEGQHLFLDKTNANRQNAVLMLLEQLPKLQEQCGATMLNLRDFETDPELHNLFLAEGYVKIDLPETNTISKEKLSWDSIEHYLEKISSNSRKNLRRDVLPYEDYYDVEIQKNVTEKEIDYWYELYRNVEKRNLTLNIFILPKKLFQKMVEHKNWEIITLTLKKEYDDRTQRLPIAVGFIYRSEKSYCPMFLGLDYYYLFSYKNYKQLLFQVVKRANALGLEKIYFGFTANMEKHKYGSVAVPKVAYIQTNDGFNMQVMELTRGNEIRKEMNAESDKNAAKYAEQISNQ